MKKTIGLFLLIIFTAPILSASKQDESYGPSVDIAPELAKKAAEFNRKSGQLKLAVLPFVAIPVSADNSFGEFYSNLLISELKKNNKNIRIFERSRLDIIIKENSMSLTGIMDSGQIERIGRLAEIDFILTGTYTVLKSHIEVNGRLVDVATGEIVYTFNRQAPAGAFGKSQRRDASADKCNTENIKRLLSDLTSDSKVKGVVDEAVKVPFDNNCGKIHYSVMSQLGRYSIFPSDYKKFLIKSMNAIELPSDDYRCSEMLRYFSKDGIDSDEWEAGRDALKRTSGVFHIYIASLFNPNLKSGDEINVQCRRIDEYFSLVESGKIGLPKPITFDRGFIELADGLRPNYDDTDNRLLAYIFRNYKDRVSKRESKKLNGYLKKMFFREKDENRKKEILEWICGNFAGYEVDNRLADDMFDFARSISGGAGKSKASSDEKKYLRLFIAKCSGLIASSFPLTKYKGQIKERTLFCIEYDIKCQLVPGMDDIGKMLYDENIHTQMEGGEYLEKYGARAKPLEPKIIKLLRRTERMNVSGTTNLQWSLVRSLGYINSGNQESIAILIEHLRPYPRRVSAEAADALSAMGKTALPYLINALPKEEVSTQIRIVKIFRMQGKDARSAVPVLNALYSKTGNRLLRDEIEDTLEALK